MMSARGAADAPRDLYAVLGVEPSASAERITSAFRRLVRELHPDTRAEDATSEELGRVLAAYETLRDPALRAAYDREHRPTSRPQDSHGVHVVRVVVVDPGPTTARVPPLRVGPVRVERVY